MKFKPSLPAGLSAQNISLAFPPPKRATAMYVYIPSQMSKIKPPPKSTDKPYAY